jgi:hypothetical protein
MRICLARPWMLACAALVACAAEPPPEPESGASASRGADAEYRAEIRTFCDVDQLSGADANDPLAAAEQRERYLLERTKHPDAVYFLTVWRTKPSAEQAEMLAAEAREAHLADCKLATTLASSSGS